jgi:hypothetical protein
VAVVLGLYFIPIPHSFSFTVSPIGPPVVPSEFRPPPGSHVEGPWSAVHGIRVNLVIQNSLNVWVYSSYATNGSYAFTADRPPYLLYLSSASRDAAGVNGTYYSPLW